MFIKGPDHSAQVIPPLEKRTADGALSHDYFSLQFISTLDHRQRKELARNNTARSTNRPRHTGNSNRQPHKHRAYVEGYDFSMQPYSSLMGVSQILHKTRASNLQRIKRILFGEKQLNPMSQTLNLPRSIIKDLRSPSFFQQIRAPIKISEFTLGINGKAVNVSTLPSRTFTPPQRNIKQPHTKKTTTTQGSLQLENLEFDKSILATPKVVLSKTCRGESGHSTVKILDLHFGGGITQITRAQRHQRSRKFSLDR